MFDHSPVPVDRPSPGIRRMCLFGDARSYSSRDALGQMELQRALTDALTTACRRADLDRAQWIRQEQGDGELALLPPGIDEAWTLNGLVRELRAWLYHYNRDRHDDARLRVRLAVHEGIVYAADNGFAGEAVVTVARLCDAEPAKRALNQNPRADLVLIVSERIFHDIVGQNLHELLADDFDQVQVSKPEKGFHEHAWVALPGRPAREHDGGGSTHNHQGDVHGKAVAAGEIRDVEMDRQGDVNHVFGDYYREIKVDRPDNLQIGGHRHEHRTGREEE